MKVKQEEVTSYLKTKDVFYKLGWECCEAGLDAMSIRRRIKEDYQEEFDQGYGDCYANGESTPDTFDYVEGI